MLEQTRLDNSDSVSADGLLGRFQGRYFMLLLMSVVLALFWVLISKFAIDAGPTPTNIICLFAITLLGARWRSLDLPAFFNAIVFSLNTCCIIYLVGSRATYDPGFANGILNSAWLPVAAGLIAFLVPSFVIWPAIAMQWSKVHIADATGWGSSGTADYIIVPDLTILLALMLSVLTVVRLMGRVHKNFDLAASVDPTSYCSASVVIVAAVHLSNYFYSGICKIFLPNGGPLTWVLENKTYFLSLHASDMGFITIQNILKGLGVHFEITRLLLLFNEPINIAVLVGQLMALICLLSMKRAAQLTIFFDIMHVGIFLLTGIFFWKWIILNAAFVFSFAQLGKRSAPHFSTRLYGCAVVVAAPLAFHVVKLAWYDTGAVNELTFQAVTMDDRTVPVPSNFFLDSSIDVAQQSFARPYNGFLPTGTWGTTLYGDIMKGSASNCQEQVANFLLSDTDRARVSLLLQRQQRLALELADHNGHVGYDIYPHHIWSSPWLFQEFSGLDIRSVKSYMLSIQSFCVSVDSSGVVRRMPVGKVTYDFPVQASVSR
ncbi:hypothetical protein [Rhizobium leguminosarum]|uniref:hypothetical protein n=3 Tax=Rhizobium TaxID=379 RepID=UPI0024738C5C|nr:hypothetical protein [Rhizobium leguminosarum]